MGALEQATACTPPACRPLQGNCLSEPGDPLLEQFDAAEDFKTKASSECSRSCRALPQPPWRRVRARARTPAAACPLHEPAAGFLHGCCCCCCITPVYIKRNDNGSRGGHIPGMLQVAVMQEKAKRLRLAIVSYHNHLRCMAIFLFTVRGGGCSAP